MKTTDIPATRGERALPRRQLFLFTLACCAFFVGMDTFIVVALILAMTLDVHVSPHIGGLLVTAYALCYALLAPLFGPIGDQRGRKPVILSGLVVFGAGTFLTGMGTSFPFLLVMRALTGLGGLSSCQAFLPWLGIHFPMRSVGE
jgi:predicted MFS family arabinose efflux permease